MAAMLSDLLLNFLWRIGIASSSTSTSSSTVIGSSSHWRQIPSLISPVDDKKHCPHRTQFSCCSSSWVFMWALKLQANANRLLHSSQACGLSPKLEEEEEETGRRREIIKLFFAASCAKFSDLIFIFFLLLLQHAYGNSLSTRRN